MSEWKERDAKRRIEVHDRRRITPDGDVVDAADDAAEPVAEDAAAEGEAGMALAGMVSSELFEAEQRRADEAESRLREYAAAVQRHRDELDAVRARLERDQDVRVRAEIGRTLESILPALDDLDRALEFADDSPLAEGMRLVRERLLAALADAGLEPIDVEGETFDPNVADALAVIPVAEASQNNVVISQVRRGWRHGDQVLRPAQVHVARAVEGESAPGTTG